MEITKISQIVIDSIPTLADVGDMIIKNADRKTVTVTGCDNVIIENSKIETLIVSLTTLKALVLRNCKICAIRIEGTMIGNFDLDGCTINRLSVTRSKVTAFTQTGTIIGNHTAHISMYASHTTDDTSHTSRFVLGHVLIAVMRMGGDIDSLDATGTTIAQLHAANRNVKINNFMASNSHINFTNKARRHITWKSAAPIRLIRNIQIDRKAA